MLIQIYRTTDATAAGPSEVSGRIEASRIPQGRSGEILHAPRSEMHSERPLSETPWLDRRNLKVHTSHFEFRYA